LFAWLLLGQLPSGLQFAGGAFILAGVTLVRVDELGPAPAAAGRAELAPRVPEVADSGVPSRAGQPNSVM
jgi:hypothetical protein